VHKKKHRNALRVFGGTSTVLLVVRQCSKVYRILLFLLSTLVLILALISCAGSTGFVRSAAWAWAWTRTRTRTWPWKLRLEPWLRAERDFRYATVLIARSAG
jgi:hypothetical protein